MSWKEVFIPLQRPIIKKVFESSEENFLKFLNYKECVYSLHEDEEEYKEKFGIGVVAEVTIGNVCRQVAPVNKEVKRIRNWKIRLIRRPFKTFIMNKEDFERESEFFIKNGKLGKGFYGTDDITWKGSVRGMNDDEFFSRPFFNNTLAKQSGNDEEYVIIRTPYYNIMREFRNIRKDGDRGFFIYNYDAKVKYVSEKYIKEKYCNSKNEKYIDYKRREKEKEERNEREWKEKIEKEEKERKEKFKKNREYLYSDRDKN